MIASTASTKELFPAPFAPNIAKDFSENPISAESAAPRNQLSLIDLNLKLSPYWRQLFSLQFRQALKVFSLPEERLTKDYEVLLLMRQGMCEFHRWRCPKLSQF
jgi:hypothetical protein